MPEYRTPGVYVEEISSGARPITAVGTRTAGFVGKAPVPSKAAGTAVAVSSWSQFRSIFFPETPEFVSSIVQVVTAEATTRIEKGTSTLSAADVKTSAEAKLKDFLTDAQIQDSVIQKIITDAAAAAAKKMTDLSKEFKAFDAAKTAAAAAASTDAQKKALKTAEDEYRRSKAAMVQDVQDAASQAGSGGFKTWTNLTYAVYGFFLNGGSRCYVVDTDDVQAGLDELAKIDEIAMVAAPGNTSDAVYRAITDHCEGLKDRVGILDGPQAIGSADLDRLGGETGAGSSWTAPGKSKTGHVSLYVPWLVISDPTARLADNKTVEVPPSGHIAGIWARSDATRGVHKAPANEPVRGALNLTRRITDSEQAALNDNGVNVIRFFQGEGILVWGARTYSPKGDALWRYLNVRRLFNMIEESIEEGTRWIVFEPNNRDLWAAIRRDVEAFLIQFWRDGALFGRTPAEAFFVKCDDETNTPATIQAGKVIIEVGIAPVRPAEFVIFRISQYEANTEVNVVGG